MINLTPTPPSHTLFYWKPWREDADLFGSWLDYKKDVTLAKYTADSIGQYIAQANNNQVNAINDVSRKLGTGFDILSNKFDTLSLQLTSIESELGLVNQNLELQIEQQNISNLLLQNIGELLRVPNSEKERQRNIENGLKFYVNAQKDDDLFGDALEELLKAESLMKQDYFVLHRIGMIYLHSLKHIDLQQALDYFIKAAKYASVESDPNALRLVNALTIDKSAVNSEITNNINSIGLLASDSYDKAAFASYILGNYNDSVKFQEKALNLNDIPKNYFLLAKYQARNNQIDSCILNLAYCIEKAPTIILLLFKDLDLINVPEVISLIENKNNEINKKIQSTIEQWRILNSDASTDKIAGLNKIIESGFDVKAIKIKQIQDGINIINIKVQDHLKKMETIINSDDFLSEYSVSEQNEIKDNLKLFLGSENLPLEAIEQLYESIEKKTFFLSCKIGDKIFGGVVFHKKGAKVLIVSDSEVEYKKDDYMVSWVKANKECQKLGEGWRLPTLDELKIIYENRKKINCFKDGYLIYWSSTLYETSLTRSKRITVPSGFLGLSTETKRVEEISQVITDASTIDFETGEVDGGPVYFQPYEDGKPFGSRNDAEFEAFIRAVREIN